MMVQPLLAATTLESLQIVSETILFVLLIYGISKCTLSSTDLILVLILLITYFISLFANSITTTFLNFKIYGLCISVLIYFNKINFYPKRVIFFFLILNILYAFSARFLNFWPIESLSIFEKKDTYIFSRPVGLLGTPHATTNFLCIYFLFLAQTKGSKLQLFVIFIAILFYASWTSLISLIVQLVYLFFNKIVSKTINPYFFLAIALIVSFFSVNLLLYYASTIEGARYYSFEILAPMFFDPKFYEGAFPLIPQSSALFIAHQESTFTDVGNEMGFIKVFVEGGVILGVVTIFSIVKRVEYFSLFFLITLLHYCYFINMPFILFIALMFTKEINICNEKKRLKNKCHYTEASVAV